MGYTHDTHMSKFISPVMIQKTAGTWTPSVSSNVELDVRTAADAAFTLLIPIPLPSNSEYRKGCKLVSIDVFYKIGTAAADDFATVALNKYSLPANDAAPSGAAVTCMIDAAHDTAAERLAVDDHTMTVTLTTPEWIDNDAAFMLSLVIDAAATTVFTLYGARANYTARN